MSKEELFERHRHLIYETRKRVAPPQSEAEEIEAEGTLALLRVIDRYDPERGVKFQTYARSVLRGEMRHYLKDTYRFAHPLPHAVPGLEAGRWLAEEEPLLEAAIDPTPPVEEQVLTALQAERVRAVVNGLPERMRHVIRLRYWEGCSLSACGRLMGVAPNTVLYHERRALRRLRAQLRDWREG